jgi:hypothetical protein
MRALTALCLLCVALSASAQPTQQPVPILSGYVTRVASGSDFDVNATRILCGPNTRIELPARDAYTPGCPQTPPLLGQRVDVYGRRKKKLDAIAADRLDIQPISLGDISGHAVIDAVTAVNPAAGTVEIRTDGYPILITPRTGIAFEPPLASIADVMTNVWAEYDAKPGPGGVFIAREAKFSQNFITRHEDAMREKTDYDPAAVPLTARQNPVVTTVGGHPDPKRIPP